MDLLLRLIAALGAVIALASLLKPLCRRAGQPPVIAELLAGLLLGPSVLGEPLSEWVLPPQVEPSLRGVAYVGILLYLFRSGRALGFEELRRSAPAVLATTSGTLLVPAICGILLAPHLYASRLAGAVSSEGFAVFVAVAMSVTAFPVLARLLEELRLIGTPAGKVALASAALNDLAAWSGLAVLVGVSPGLPLFAAFGLGLLWPRRARMELLPPQWERGLTATLMPAFFALTGMRTRLDLLDSSREWLLAVAVVLVAVVGKVGGAILGCRLAGLGWRTAGIVGVLMNTRGLMELVVLHVGLEANFISRELFAILVMMTLATTLATAPLVRRMAFPPSAGGLGIAAHA